MAADEPEAVGLMLESLYGYDYLDGRDTRATHLKTHVWIAQIATKYMLPQLRWAAFAGFGSASTEAWQCDEFAEAVDMICFLGEEAGGLADIATKVIIEHAAALLHDDAYRCFQEVLGKHASLAISVAKGLSRVGFEKEKETDDWPSFQLTKKKKSRKSAMVWDT
ncbi:BTB/POZ protein [Teratosphaeria destructans]|uniref:BTB/POZ protein n=1 Tax=Teratosphaeria destructans TaxID=418781 RepID=A0A9W7SV90_9PEZI|nr:BTB/POZ protein [Teratosphaeria destructans]